MTTHELLDLGELYRQHGIDPQQVQHLRAKKRLVAAGRRGTTPLFRLDEVMEALGRAPAPPPSTAVVELPQLVEVGIEVGDELAPEEGEEVDLIPGDEPEAGIEFEVRVGPESRRHATPDRPDKAWLTRPEAATLMACTPTTITGWTTRGLLTPRDGFYARADLLALRASREAEAREASLRPRVPPPTPVTDDRDRRAEIAAMGLCGALERVLSALDGSYRVLWPRVSAEAVGYLAELLAELRVTMLDADVTLDEITRGAVRE